VPPSASSARPRLRGRHWVLLWLLVFLATAAAIQQRQASAAATARSLAQLTSQRSALEAERAALVREIRRASSRAQIQERAERELGLHVASTSESSWIRDAR
jgi:cell division protein FtsB